MDNIHYSAGNSQKIHIFARLCLNLNMAEIINNNVNYGDDNIRTLEGVEHIRLRPGMYIGRLGNGDDLGDGI